MRQIPIPTAFSLHAQRITVEWVPDLIEKENVVEHAALREDLIRLQRNTDSVHRPRAQQERTFFHELVHWILEEMSEGELRDNEKFVDTFAGLLHQALATAEYEYEESPIEPPLFGDGRDELVRRMDEATMPAAGHPHPDGTEARDGPR